jgi:hypothetical protein
LSVPKGCSETKEGRRTTEWWVFAARCAVVETHTLNVGQTREEIMQMKKLMVLLLALSAITGGAEEKQIEVRLTVPDAAWKIAIDSVHQVNKEIWVVSTVSRDPDIMGAQVISTVTAKVKISVGDLPVKHFVIGKTWNWKNEESYTFIKDLKQIEKDLAAGKVLYKRIK